VASCFSECEAGWRCGNRLNCQFLIPSRQNKALRERFLAGESSAQTVGVWFLELKFTMNDFEFS